jgi:hypothetical protein
MIMGRSDQYLGIPAHDHENVGVRVAVGRPGPDVSE